MGKQYLTVNEVCIILSISKSTLYRMISDGDFPPPTRIGKRKSRWHVNVVQEYIDRLEDQGKEAA